MAKITAVGVAIVVDVVIIADVNFRQSVCLSSQPASKRDDGASPPPPRLRTNGCEEATAARVDVVVVVIKVVIIIFDVVVVFVVVTFQVSGAQVIGVIAAFVRIFTTVTNVTVDADAADRRFGDATTIDIFSAGAVDTIDSGIVHANALLLPRR
jgi:hypothetical protein